MKYLVFVYGTLKSNNVNNYLLKGFPYQKAIAKGIAIYNPTGIPFASKVDEECHVLGELYEIDNKAMNRLDILEGHPNFYQRELIDVIAESGKTVRAWIYLYRNARKYKRIEGCEWKPREIAMQTA